MNWFRYYAERVGFKNAYLAFFDEESEQSAFNLVELVRRAWDGLPPVRPTE